MQKIEYSIEIKTESIILKEDNRLLLNYNDLQKYKVGEKLIGAVEKEIIPQAKNYKKITLLIEY